MKKLLFCLLLFCLVPETYAQKADAIVGEWISEHKDGRIQVYRKGDEYFGKLIWIQDQTVLDAYNPDPALRSRPLMGSVILSNIKFVKNSWEDGRIYDPQSGKSYSCNMQLANDKTLKIRGYIGISLLGRTSVWSKATL
ncbi:DUF2147 domain-containing protein [Fibrella aquatilis]|uniref:DUF2147 domain-containing protein n=1 Tax=Fibrella aquatilis TaxID=2817059 RepID=A0A939K100_9BACT|nr:DUF2147 domain-containing protein [Fibrella aquatilis]MBO0932993.1 DUF2147 domain-containing protein [Fibrella aquatilis]